MEQVKTSRRQVKTIMSVKLIKFIFSRTVVNILSCIPDNLHYTVMVVIGNLLTSFSFIPLQLSTSFFYTYAHHLTAFYQRFSISSHTHPSLSRCSFLLCHHSDSGLNLPHRRTQFGFIMAKYSIISHQVFPVGDIWKPPSVRTMLN